MGTFGGERDSLSRQGHSFGSVGSHHGRSKPGQSLSVFPFFKVHSHFELIDLSTHPILRDGMKENHYLNISTLVCNTHCGYIRST